jgi:hypothetical protein
MGRSATTWTTSYPATVAVDNGGGGSDDDDDDDDDDDEDDEDDDDDDNDDDDACVVVAAVFVLRIAKRTLGSWSVPLHNVTYRVSFPRRSAQTDHPLCREILCGPGATLASRTRSPPYCMMVSPSSKLRVAYAVNWVVPRLLLLTLLPQLLLPMWLLLLPPVSLPASKNAPFDLDPAATRLPSLTCSLRGGAASAIFE